MDHSSFQMVTSWRWKPYSSRISPTNPRDVPRAPLTQFGRGAEFTPPQAGHRLFPCLLLLGHQLGGASYSYAPATRHTSDTQHGEYHLPPLLSTDGKDRTDGTDGTVFTVFPCTVYPEPALSRVEGRSRRERSEVACTERSEVSPLRKCPVLAGRAFRPDRRTGNKPGLFGASPESIRDERRSRRLYAGSP